LGAQGEDWFPLASTLSYRSVQFSSWLKREDNIAALITRIEVVKLSMEKRRNAIIIFVPNVCRCYGLFINNKNSITDANF
jgi:hypothetical protein